MCARFFSFLCSFEYAVTPSPYICAAPVLLIIETRTVSVLGSPIHTQGLTWVCFQYCVMLLGLNMCVRVPYRHCLYYLVREYVWRYLSAGHKTRRLVARETPPLLLHIALNLMILSISSTISCINTISIFMLLNYSDEKKKKKIFFFF